MCCNSVDSIEIAKAGYSNKIDKISKFSIVVEIDWLENACNSTMLWSLKCVGIKSTYLWMLLLDQHHCRNLRDRVGNWPHSLRILSILSKNSYLQAQFFGNPTKFLKASYASDQQTWIETKSKSLKKTLKTDAMS